MSEPVLKVEIIYLATGTTSRPGGMQAGDPPSAIRVTHIPTGTMAQCGLERSQHKNKKMAMEMLEYVLGKPALGNIL